MDEPRSNTPQMEKYYEKRAAEYEQIYEKAERQDELTAQERDISGGRGDALDGCRRAEGRHGEDQDARVSADHHPGAHEDSRDSARSPRTW